MLLAAKFAIYLACSILCAFTLLITEQDFPSQRDGERLLLLTVTLRKDAVSLPIKYLIAPADINWLGASY